jgi:hypothetical protein
LSDRKNPDILVKDSKGNIYYAPGSAVRLLPPDHALRDTFDTTRPNDYKVWGLAGRIESSDFVLEDGQNSTVPGGSQGLELY